MIEIWQSFGTWAWELITGIQPLISWLFTAREFNFVFDTITIAPIYLIGGGAGAVVLIAGIVRAIV